jgi:DNA-binding transcriptional regulator YiaG
MTSQELKNLMSEHGVKSPQLAELIGVSVHCIHKYRNGQRAILEPVARYIRIVLEQYLNNTHPPGAVKEME